MYLKASMESHGSGRGSALRKSNFMKMLTETLEMYLQ